MGIWFFSVLSLVAGAGAAWLVRVLIVERRMVRRVVYEQLKEQLQSALIAHAAEVARFRAELQYREEAASLQKQDMLRMGEQMETQFRIMANTILEEKTEKFSGRQEQSLKAILDPLKEHINTFRQDYETKRSRESEERISLREQIKQMMELNRSLSDQANNLTNALRGNVKMQGHWGEMILESILQHAGLQKGLQYFPQEQSRNGTGRLIQPDVIVRYPDDRAIVIDSKVSLVHYDDYCSAGDAGRQAAALAGLARSVKSHIDGLHVKGYQDVSGALDVVMMFVPVEAAYITAVQNEPSLWQYAYNKRILLVSPASLITAMKLVADMWQRDSINREAHMIADRAGKLYDKLVGFIENFEKVGQQIQRSQDTWQDAYGQLYRGRGNAISIAEEMKSYSARTSKSLPANLVEEALIEAGTSPQNDG